MHEIIKGNRNVHEFFQPAQRRAHAFVFLLQPRRAEACLGLAVRLYRLFGLTELFQKAEVVAEEVPNIVDAVLLHHDTFRP
ncbi:MAG: hypothetical protein OXE40_14210, partial [Gammaproteobacteria bacterium]|nr:hypothetical protein [Gammaproteobacteria bacterium]